MKKNDIRNLMRERISKIDQKTRLIHSQRIFHTIENMPQFAAAKSIAIYHALPDEPQTIETIERWNNIISKEIILPKVIDSRTINLYKYRPNSTEKGAFGITEPTTNNKSSPVNPSQIDMIIIPGVAFTKEGNRLGRGKAYYDRYLSTPQFIAANVLKIGVCFPHQIIEKMPCEEHDIKVDIVICE
ncbi:MAG: 5-formyltetrahydrofolate cyclo-ligase [Rikenellaceae bacterium]